MTANLFSRDWSAVQAWMIDSFVATTLLMLVVLLLRGPVAARLGARAAYMLWLAPALRMVMPPLPTTFATLPVQRVQEAIFVAASPSVTVTPALTDATTGLTWGILLTLVWLGGALLFFAHHQLAYRRFVRRIRATAQLVDSSDKIGISTSPLVTSPLAYGIFGKAIIVPHDFGTRFDAIEQRLALAHELTHHRRGDPIINAAALAMLALHWFNPVAHIAHRAFRLDQESACDAVVLRKASAADRHAYGSALFKAAMGPVPLAACAMAAATTLKARLRRIIAQPQSGVTTAAGAALAAVLIVVGVMVTASNGIAASQLPVETITPRAIILGGGIIDAEAAKAAELALDQAEAAFEAAESAADAASDAADAASAKALSDADHARADVARARADLARAQADSARAEADFARSEADRQSRALSEMPEPPAPPQSEEAPAPPAPPSALSLSRLSCPAGSERRLVETEGQRGSKVATKFAIMICMPSRQAMHREIRAALLSARQTITTEPTLGDLQRREALAALDREIASLTQDTQQSK